MFHLHGVGIIACKRIRCIFMEAHCIYCCFTVRVMRIKLPELLSSFPLGAKTNQSEVNLCLGTYLKSLMCIAAQFARGERGFCLHGKHFQIDKALQKTFCRPSSNKSCLTFNNCDLTYNNEPISITRSSTHSLVEFAFRSNIKLFCSI